MHRQRHQLGSGGERHRLLGSAAISAEGIVLAGMALGGITTKMIGRLQDGVKELS
jgi:hypothetical protein